MNQKKHKIQSFFNKVTVKTISETVIRSIDPELLSFFNINTPEDLTTAAILRQKAKKGDFDDIK